MSNLNVNDVVKIRLNGFISPVSVSNVFHYQVTAGNTAEADPQTLAIAFWTLIQNEYRNLVTTNYTTAFLTIDVEHVRDLTGVFGTYNIPASQQAGLRVPPTGQGEGFVSAFMAVGVRLNVETRRTRPGQKRLWGLSEHDIIGNTLTPDAVARAALVASRLDDPISYSPAGTGPLTLVPVVLGADANVIGPSRTNRVVGFTVQPSVRTQVSRRVPTTA